MGKSATLFPMDIATEIARRYDAFKREHDRYPVRIEVSAQVFASLLEAIRKPDLVDFIYDAGTPSINYKTVPVVRSDSMAGTDPLLS